MFEIKLYDIDGLVKLSDRAGNTSVLRLSQLAQSSKDSESVRPSPNQGLIGRRLPVSEVSSTLVTAAAPPVS